MIGIIILLLLLAGLILELIATWNGGAPHNLTAAGLACWMAAAILYLLHAGLIAGVRV